MITCKDCDNTGIAIVQLDSTKDTGIQRCDTCNTLTDAQAVAAVKRLVRLYGHGENFRELLARDIVEAIA